MSDDPELLAGQKLPDNSKSAKRVAALFIGPRNQDQMKGSRAFHKSKGVWIVKGKRFKAKVFLAGHGGNKHNDAVVEWKE